MSRVRMLNCAGYLAVFLSYIFTGWATFIIGRCFQMVLSSDLPGKPLPDLTRFVLACTTLHLWLVFNAIMGLAVLVMLHWLEFGDQTRRQWIPFALIAACAIPFLQVSTMLEGVALPYFYVTFGMTDQRAK